MIYPNGILMLGVIYEFIRLFRKIEDNNPFTKPTVNILKQTGVITFIMSIIWLLDLVFMITIMKNTYINYILVLLFLCILFLGVSIALYMLSVLIKQATEYKEENDLTI
jgi:membrane-bound ClpP family serine protease